MITSETWLLFDKFKEDRIEYEKYTQRVTNEKIDFAKTKMDEKDFEILKLISNLEITTSLQLARMTFKNKNGLIKFADKYCNYRLRKLYKLGCIDRFFPFEHKHGSPLTHVVLGPIGAKVLNKTGFRRIKTLNQNWRHTVLINEIFSNFSVKYDITRWRKEVILEWQDEKGRDNVQRPDAFMLYRDTSRIKASMIEADMGTENIETLIKKVKKYIEYFNGNEFKTAKWQPYLNRNAAIIPEIIFIMKYKNDANRFKKRLEKIESNVVFKVSTLEEINISV